MTSWDDVVTYLRAKGYHEKLTLVKPFKDPSSAGMYRSWGIPVGQLADYRKLLPDGKGLHVREFQTTYESHIDEVDPSKSIVGHFIMDMPAISLAGLVLITGKIR